MNTATLTSKGQITIPVEVRKALHLDAGDEIVFFDLGDGQFAFRPRTGSIRDLKGIVPRLDKAPTLEELNESVGAAIEEEYLESVRPEKPAGRKNKAA